MRVRQGLWISVAGALLRLALAPTNVAAGITCAVPRSRQVLSGFASSRMDRLFRESRRTRVGSRRSRVGGSRFGSPRFGSIRFGSTRFGRSRSSGLAGGRMSELFSVSRTRFSSRKFFSLTPRCQSFGGR